MKTRLASSLAILLAALLSTLIPAQAAKTTRISIPSDGTPGNRDSSHSATSADARFAAFQSEADNLVDGDTNDAWDIFVHDRQSGTTTRVSVASNGAQGNDDSFDPAISADGRFVAFNSRANNLVAGGTSGIWDVFVHDRLSGTTTRVSVASDGTQSIGISGYPDKPAISADGRFVAFESEAANLVDGDTNNNQDVFVHDRLNGTTTRVSIASDSTQGNRDSSYPTISADGRFVAFSSWAGSLVDDDTNNDEDVFVHDLLSGTTTRVSVASNGTQGNDGSSYPAISADGGFVAFVSGADNLVAGDKNGSEDVFVHDRLSGKTTRVSIASNGTQGKDSSFDPVISDDGRFVAFTAYANNLVAGDTNNYSDVFVHDRLSGTTTRVSVTSDGTQSIGYDGSGEPAISADARFVVFESGADNLVDGDTNKRTDVFVHDRSSGTTTRVSVASDSR